MKVHILSCQIFESYIETLIAKSLPSYDYTLEYLEIDQHNHPEILNQFLQKRIDEISDVDAILLIYGICGNATKGIKAKNIKLLIPRVHDCATILLGGKDQFEEVFGHRPSQGWKSLNYDKNEFHNVSVVSNPQYLELLKKYGEDNAMYLFEMLYPQSEDEIYISLGLKGDETKILNLKENTEIVNGSLRFLESILTLEFDELLIVNPGEEIVMVYDKEEVMTKK